jgi:hypothetical protein
VVTGLPFALRGWFALGAALRSRSWHAK